MERLHGRKVNFERGCRINGQKGTNVEHSLQNNNIQQKNLPTCYLTSYLYRLFYAFNMDSEYHMLSCYVYAYSLMDSE